tara:strand:- start:7446 stop:8240 length:795 start_codon:yes stop_codon:yes gene_type:complete
MTLAEILAGIRAGQAVGQSESFTNLTGVAAEERASLADARRKLQEQRKERERQAARQERRRGGARTIGALGGAALALLASGGTAMPLVLGAASGLGSFLGQKAAGDLSLDDVRSGLGGGMFFRGARENISGAERDINRFLNEAEQNFKQRQAVSAIGDAITGYRAGNFLANFDPSKKFSIGDLFKREPKVTQLNDTASLLDPPKAMDLLEPIKDRINIPVATPSAYETGMRLLEFQENNPMSAVSNARRGSFLMGSGAGYNPFG